MWGSSRGREIKRGESICQSNPDYLLSITQVFTNVNNFFNNFRHFWTLFDCKRYIVLCLWWDNQKNWHSVKPFIGAYLVGYTLIISYPVDINKPYFRYFLNFLYFWLYLFLSLLRPFKWLPLNLYRVKAYRCCTGLKMAHRGIIGDHITYSGWGAIMITIFTAILSILRTQK